MKKIKKETKIITKYTCDFCGEESTRNCSMCGKDLCNQCKIEDSLDPNFGDFVTLYCPKCVKIGEDYIKKIKKIEEMCDNITERIYNDWKEKCKKIQ